MTKTTSTVQLEALVIQLDCLREAYQSVFVEAQAQLEGLELTSDQLVRISNRLASDSRLTTQIQRSAIKQLTSDLTDLDSNDIEAEDSLQPLLNVITKRVYDTLKPGLEECVLDTVKFLITPEFVTEHVMDTISIKQEIVNSFRKQNILDSIMESYSLLPKDAKSEQTTTQND